MHSPITTRHMVIQAKLNAKYRWLKIFLVGFLAEKIPSTPVIAIQEPIKMQILLMKASDLRKINMDTAPRRIDIRPIPKWRYPETLVKWIKDYLYERAIYELVKLELRDKCLYIDQTQSVKHGED